MNTPARTRRAPLTHARVREMARAGVMVWLDRDEYGANRALRITGSSTLPGGRVGYCGDLYTIAPNAEGTAVVSRPVIRGTWGGRFYVSGVDPHNTVPVVPRDFDLSEWT